MTHFYFKCIYILLKMLAEGKHEMKCSFIFFLAFTPRFSEEITVPREDCQF